MKPKEDRAMDILTECASKIRNGGTRDDIRAYLKTELMEHADIEGIIKNLEGVYGRTYWKAV